MQNPFARSKCFPLIRFDLALHIVPLIRYLGFTLQWRRVPWLRRRTCPLACPNETWYAYAPSTPHEARLSSSPNHKDARGSRPSDLVAQHDNLLHLHTLHGIPSMGLLSRRRRRRRSSLTLRRGLWWMSTSTTKLSKCWAFTRTFITLEQVEVHGNTLEGFWRMITREANSQRSSIQNPIIKVFHSWMCKRILGRIKETKITDVELNWLYSALIVGEPIDSSQIMINWWCCEAISGSGILVRGLTAIGAWSNRPGSPWWKFRFFQVFLFVFVHLDQRSVLVKPCLILVLFARSS
jgi:hypothetical protein